MTVTVGRCRELDATFAAPPSKSFTHRALIAAALAEGRSTLADPLVADDTELTAAALRQLGVPVVRTDRAMVVEGCGGAFPDLGPQTISCGNSGTSLRLLASVALLAPRPVILTGSRRMQERPVGGLAAALARLGGRVRYLGADGFPPVEMTGRLVGGRASIDARASSQFISSILLAAPCAEGPVELEVAGTAASRSYLDITTALMGEFGIGVDRDGYRRFRVEPGRYRPREYRIEGDFSSASYLFAAAAVCGGTVRVTGLNPQSVQGDAVFPAILETMGCAVARRPGMVEITGGGTLHGVSVDLSSAPDIVQTLAAVAAFADSPTRITGIGHLRHKESDRIAAVVRMLDACGVTAEAEPDALTIRPGPVRGGTVDPEGDHRTAMAAAVLGLGAGGVRIRDPGCVSKSFPGFWEMLREGGVWNGSC